MNRLRTNFQASMARGMWSKYWGKNSDRHDKCGLQLYWPEISWVPHDYFIVARTTILLRYSKNSYFCFGLQILGFGIAFDIDFSKS